MSTSDMQQILQLVDRLTPEERERLRAAIDSPEARHEEDDINHLLLQEGLILEIPRPAATRESNPEPIEVEGIPISQTIIEDRR